MNLNSPESLTKAKPRFGQFTLRTLLIGVALVCLVLGWRQMVRQHAFNGLWELASEKSAWDWRVQNEIGEAMYRLVSLENPPPCFVSRIDERKRELAIMQVDAPMDPAAQTYVRLTVLNRFGKVNSIDTLRIGPGMMAIDDASLVKKRDGVAIITFRIRIAAEPIPEPLILVVEGGKIRQAGKTETLPVDSPR